MQLSDREQEYLNRFDKELGTLLAQCPGNEAQKKLLEVGRHLCLGGSSKRIRPLLIWHFGQILSLDERDIVKLSLATELMHGASLLHDDVVDNATTRRGKVSANVQFSNSISVLGGNFLLTKAFQVLAYFNNDVVSGAIDVIAHMTEGALLEISIQRKLDIQISAWKEMVAGKTGALFAWCGESVGLVGNNADAAGRFSRCGGQIGMAFQLADDVKDFTGDAGLKEKFLDLRNGEPSYPILLALERSEAFRQACGALWNSSNEDERRFKEAADLLKQSGVGSLCGLQITKEALGAVDSLGAHVEHPNGNRIKEIADALRHIPLTDSTASV